jgi:long-chain acyl-CoA synthetase
MGLFSDLEDRGDRVAVLTANGRVISFEELASISDRIAARIETRSLVVVLCSNSVEALSGYIGFQRAGHVCLMVPAAIEPQRLESIFGEFRPNYVWGPKDTPNVSECEIITAEGDHVLRLVSLKSQALYSDLALLMPTSGSTGSPMMVRQSVQNLLANAESIALSLGLGIEDRAITTLPMFYTYGLSIIHSQLAVGGSIVLNEYSLMDRLFWSKLSDTSPTYFGGVPYTYEVLHRLGVTRLKDSTIRMLTQAGGKLKPEIVTAVHEAAEAIGIDFHVMYGQTEATARMSVLNSSEVAARPRSIGKPIPKGSFRIVDPESGIELPVGTEGELEYSGPNVALGYASNFVDLSEGDTFCGRLRTGDLAFGDAEGFYYISGRLKRFLKLFGNRINLDHVEDILQSLNVVAACTGCDDQLTVHVASNSNEIDVQTEIAKFLGVYRTAIRVKVVNEIPRNESGKILYSKLDEEVSSS